MPPEMATAPPERRTPAHEPGNGSATRHTGREPESYARSAHPVCKPGAGVGLATGERLEPTTAQWQGTCNGSPSCTCTTLTSCAGKDLSPLLSRGVAEAKQYSRAAIVCTQRQSRSSSSGGGGGGGGVCAWAARQHGSRARLRGTRTVMGM